MLQQLKDKRGVIVAQMRDLHAVAEKEARAFSSDDQNKWNLMDDDLQSVDAQIKRSEKLSGYEIVKPTELRAASREPQEEDKAEITEATAFRNFLKYGMAELNTEERALMANRRADIDTRAFSQGTGNVGGFTVPQDFRNELEVALKAYGGMMEVADILRTDTGATLPMPSFNYTNILATIVGEGVAGTLDTSTPFSAVNLGAFTYRSPILPVSYEFLQDSAFGEKYITDALGGAIARALNAHATTGTGTGQPRGIVVDATLGKTGITGQTVTAIYADLLDLEHSVDPLYRPGAKFMMHDSSFKVVRKIMDTSGRPIFFPGYDGLGIAGPSTILGYPVVINQDIAVMAASAKSILFGQLNKYKLRIVRDVSMLRLTERYADNLQVAFILFMRADGRLLDAGTNPVKYYINSAT